MPHIAILDIGKTNKKCFVFDSDYRIVLESTDVLLETTDEDGFPCENITALTEWIQQKTTAVLNDSRFHIKAINCTAYGASFVHLNERGQPVAPLYNYLKPFPDDLKKQFFDQYGGETIIALETASPVLGHLNSGLQLYWLKHHKPLIFKQIIWSLHLPQYVALVIRESAGESAGDFKSPADYTAASEMTSIGCHTMLWNFQQNNYHHWVFDQDIASKFPPIQPATQTTLIGSVHIGCGLHDSSSALVPYLATIREPFVLISTGTWCISLNPFNDTPLTPEELAQDCLCYLTYEGKPVKAARYFGGHIHEEMTAALTNRLDKPHDYYKTIVFDDAVFHQITTHGEQPTDDFATAYHRIVWKIVQQQVQSTRLVLQKTTCKIYVDGGFSNNNLYLNMLAKALPQLDIVAADVAQATALGAAMAMHPTWNTQDIPANLY